jgi:hypothetical protein
MILLLNRILKFVVLPVMSFCTFIPQVPGYLHGLLSNECEAVCDIALRWVAVAETWDHGRL